MGKLRIIGGDVKGRRVYFPDQLPARPTLDRIRETLFNWLMLDIDHAVCLDVFAGTGILSFEALSRGAKQVVMIERDMSSIASLKVNAQQLHMQSRCEIIHADFATVKFDNTFDIIFLDPPFKSGLFDSALQWLIAQNVLKKTSLIYYEIERQPMPFGLPKELAIYKSKKTRTECYGLICLQSSDALYTQRG